MANAEKEGMDGWSSQVRMEELLAKAATSDGRKEWYYFTGEALSGSAPYFQGCVLTLGVPSFRRSGPTRDRGASRFDVVAGLPDYFSHVMQ